MKQQREFEKYRVRNHHHLASNHSYGCNGYFILEHPRIDNYIINCIVSDGDGWDHVSVTLTSTKRKVERCPTWEEMCYVKNIFFDKSECVVQFHPAEDQYVNAHNYCLHLWRPQNETIPTPDKSMI